MEALIHSLIVALLYVIYILLIPVVTLLATPFILLWPGKKRMDGKRYKSIKQRYLRLWDMIKSFGLGLPTS